MIRSFLKRVFSSSTEVAATAEELHVTDQTENGSADLPEFSLGSTDGPESIESYNVVKIMRDWLERHSLKELEALVQRLFQQSQEGSGIPLPRLRLELDDSLQSPDSLMAKRLSKYLLNAEQEIVDFTFFLDKKDPFTVEIYKTYILPQRVQDLDSFLQERCFMIYETSIGLSCDYKEEITSLLDALEIQVGPDFFEEFEEWREELIRKHIADEEEQAVQGQEMIDSPEVFMIKISKEEVENENIQQIDQYLKKALESPEIAKSYRDTLLFSFYGFSKHEDLLKLMNRKEVNDWASFLVEKHPYIFYFLNDTEYPMTSFLTSLVVTTEVENQEVYYNEEELIAFKQYISDALEKLANWLDEDKDEVLFKFERHFQ